MLYRLNQLLLTLGLSPYWANLLDQCIAFCIVLTIAFTADYICRRLLLSFVARIVKRTKVKWYNVLLDNRLLSNIARIVAPFVISSLIPMAFAHSSTKLVGFLMKLTDIYILITILCIINSLFKSIYTLYSQNEKFRDRPLKGLLQTMQVTLWFVGVIIGIAILFERNPLTLLAGLSASAAILMLVFKDSIMGVVSGVQLSANNMLKVGDWITMPKYNADGVVIEVTLNTVKVRNWDNTISTIPPYALVSDSFQNWRGMEESGGRRIKRSISIDMNSVHFCTPPMLEKFKEIALLKSYIEKTESEIEAYNEEMGIDNSVLVNGRRQTNLGVFRAYLVAYLRSLPRINQEQTLLVRHLQPTEDGLPVELYFFSANTEWIAYEDLQADVFDHLLAIIPEFGLRVFQSPTGYDFKEQPPRARHRTR